MNYCVGDELFLSDKESSIILRVVSHIVKRTNADRIRAMSDEELAEFIPNWSDTKACKCDEQRFVDCNNECEKCVEDWLQQPAPEEGE